MPLSLTAREEKILRFLMTNREARFRDIVDHLGIQKSRVSTTLRFMCRSGLLRRVETGRYCAINTVKRKPQTQAMKQTLTELQFIIRRPGCNAKELGLELGVKPIEAWNQAERLARAGLIEARIGEQRQMLLYPTHEGVVLFARQRTHA